MCAQPSRGLDPMSKFEKCDNPRVNLSTRARV